MRRVDDDRGAVTVEAAIGISALVVVLALCFGGMSAVVDQLRCTDAAREAARLLARGDRELARRAVAEIGPGGARMDVAGDGDGLTVTVRARAALLPIGLSSAAFVVPEPGVRPGEQSSAREVAP